MPGEEATGKTFIILNILKYFHRKHPDGIIVFFDTEHSVLKEHFTSRSVNPDKVIKIDVHTIEKFAHQAIQTLKIYLKQKKADRQPMIMVLDSLGNLSTNKEIDEISNGTDVKDMSRPGKVKAAFKVLRGCLAEANVPLLVTNHIYKSMSAYTPADMSGGSGPKYLSDIICFLTKSKDKDEKTKEQVGIIMKGTIKKSRFTRDGLVVENRLSFDTGLDRYYGLLDFCIDYGLILRRGNTFIFPNEVEASRREVEEDGSKYFTEDLLTLVNEEVGRRFKLMTDVQ